MDPEPNPIVRRTQPSVRSERAHSPSSRHRPRSIPKGRSRPNAHSGTEPNQRPHVDTKRIHSRAPDASRRIHRDLRIRPPGANNTVRTENPRSGAPGHSSSDRTDPGRQSDRLPRLANWFPGTSPAGPGELCSSARSRSIDLLPGESSRPCNRRFPMTPRDSVRAAQSRMPDWACRFRNRSHGQAHTRECLPFLR